MTEPDDMDGWERHRRQQIRDGLRTTPAQRVAWVEEMIELARKVGARTAEEIQEDARTRRARQGPRSA